MRNTLLLPGLLLLGACANGGLPPPPPIARPASLCEAAPRLNAETASAFGALPANPQPMANLGRRGARVTGATLAQQVVVTEVAAARDPGGAGEVAVTLQSCASGPLRLVGAIQFVDSGGRPVEGAQPQLLELGPGSQGMGFRWRSASRPAGFFVDIREAAPR